MAVEQPKIGASLHSLVLTIISHTHIFTYICTHIYAHTRSIAIERPKTGASLHRLVLHYSFHTHIFTYIFTHAYVHTQVNRSRTAKNRSIIAQSRADYFFTHTYIYVHMFTRMYIHIGQWQQNGQKQEHLCKVWCCTIISSSQSVVWMK